MSSNIPQQKNSGSRGEYEYDIDITNNIKKMNNNNLVGGNGPSGVSGSSNPAAPNYANLGESVGSNPGSVVGHYNTSGNK